tara:strand:- start:68 stop:292 length:225 start_codon:yes stop_codon:yes gene_type:complete
MTPERIPAIEKALSWANGQGYSDARRAIVEYLRLFGGKVKAYRPGAANYIVFQDAAETAPRFSTEIQIDAKGKL